MSNFWLKDGSERCYETDTPAEVVEPDPFRSSQTEIIYSFVFLTHPINLYLSLHASTRSSHQFSHLRRIDKAFFLFQNTLSDLLSLVYMFQISAINRCDSLFWEALWLTLENHTSGIKGINSDHLWKITSPNCIWLMRNLIVSGIWS